MKQFKIVVLDAAVEDFNDALEYYKQISPKLAKKFYASLSGGPLSSFGLVGSKP